MAHKKLELHDPGKICMSVSTQFRGAKKYQVMILAPKLKDDSTFGVQFYQSPRFLCEYNKREPHCKLEDPKDIERCTPVRGIPQESDTILHYNFWY